MMIERLIENDEEFGVWWLRVRYPVVTWIYFGLWRVGSCLGGLLFLFGVGVLVALCLEFIQFVVLFYMYDLVRRV